MTRGVVLALLIAVATSASPGARAAEPHPAASAPAAKTDEVRSLDKLLEGCAKMPGLSARFVEEKQIALLAVPLRSSGTLHFARGRGLVRHTAEPSKQSVLIDDKELVIADGSNVRRIALSSSPTVETFARSFSMILAADRPALEKNFVLDFRPTSAGWSLALTPRGQELKGVIAAIELEGQGLALTLLRIREANGDVSTTRFSAVDVAKQYGAEEAARVFRVPAG